MDAYVMKKSRTSILSLSASRLAFFSFCSLLDHFYSLSSRHTLFTLNYATKKAFNRSGAP